VTADRFSRSETTLGELRIIGRMLGITGISQMSRKQLVTEIRERVGGAADTATTTQMVEDRQ
jgi:hypothetical protein